MLSIAWMAYWTVLAILGLYGGHRLFLTVQCRRCPSSVADRPPSPSPSDELPMVTVQLPLYNERYVAERLIDAVAALDWPRTRLEIQILDDSTDDTTARCQARAAGLRAAGYTVELLHRSERKGYKAGALEAGLGRARGELVLILDADFVPPVELLRHTIGYFSDPDVALVQVRWDHLNREASTLTRVQALILDGHFAVEQKARHATGRYFNFNGTAGIWRREAVEQAGGWHHDTLTEDLDLSYRALLAGWRFVYLTHTAAPAELPMGVTAFKSQQFRWAKGSIQVARKLLPRVLRAPVSTRIKLEAFFHLTQNLPYLATLALVLLYVPALILRPSSAVEALALHVPSLGLAAITLGVYCTTSQRVLGRGSWRALTRLPALIAITVGICVNQSRAVIEGALGHRSPFVRTPKCGVISRQALRSEANTEHSGRSKPTGTARRGVRRKLAGLPYRGLRDLTPIAEIALAMYFAAFAGLAAVDGRWSVIPVLLLFCAGFAYVGALSALRR
ncbi:MAG: glycosyltransferase [Proteobacteria bacterium]|nr:glycosyltransferase [Pseudomonadota bacterium]